LQVYDRHLGRLPSVLAPQVAAETNVWTCFRLIEDAIGEVRGAAFGYKYEPRKYRPWGPVTGDTVESVTYTAEGERIFIDLCQVQPDGKRCWARNLNNVWERVDEFYDEKGNRMDPPDPEVDYGWAEETNASGMLIRRWIGRNTEQHPTEIFAEGNWTDIRAFNRRKQNEAQVSE
jgi:hypothetical protein